MLLGSIVMNFSACVSSFMTMVVFSIKHSVSIIFILSF